MALTREELFAAVTMHAPSGRADAAVIWLIMGDGAVPCSDADRFEDSRQLGVVIGKRSDGIVGYVMIEGERRKGVKFRSTHVNSRILDPIAMELNSSEVRVRFGDDVETGMRRDYTTFDGRRLAVWTRDEDTIIALSISAIDVKAK